MEQQFERKQVERLVYTYADMILRLSYTYLKSTYDAEDICQTVFLKYLTSAPRFESPEHEKAWILRTAANTCKDILKSAWRTRTCDIEACAEIPAPDAADDSVFVVVQNLPDKYRIPIYLYYYEGYQIREIAEILGTRTATVNTRLDRGRKRLKQVLGGNYCEQEV